MKVISSRGDIITEGINEFNRMVGDFWFKK